MHGEVGAVGGALEVAVLLRARLRGLLAEEVEVGALLGREQFGEAREGRLARLARDADERLTLVERALPAGERERARQLLAERPRAVARGELERLPQRLAGAEREREHRDRLGQVEEDRLAPPLHLRAEYEVGDEEAGEREQEQHPGRGQAPGRGRIGKQRNERRGDRDERLLQDEAGERLSGARLAQVALVRGAHAVEPRRQLDRRPVADRRLHAGSRRAGKADRERRPAVRVRVGEREPARDQTRAREEEHEVHGPPPVRRGSGTRPSRSMSR